MQHFYVTRTHGKAKFADTPVEVDELIFQLALRVLQDEADLGDQHIRFWNAIYRFRGGETLFERDLTEVMPETAKIIQFPLPKIQRHESAPKDAAVPRSPKATQEQRRSAFAWAARECPPALLDRLGEVAAEAHEEYEDQRDQKRARHSRPGTAPEMRPSAPLPALNEGALLKAEVAAMGERIDNLTTAVAKLEEALARVMDHFFSSAVRYDALVLEREDEVARMRNYRSEDYWEKSA